MYMSLSLSIYIRIYTHIYIYIHTIYIYIYIVVYIYIYIYIELTRISNVVNEKRDSVRRHLPEAVSETATVVMCVYLLLSLSIYIYIYREREKEIHTHNANASIETKASMHHPLWVVMVCRIGLPMSSCSRIHQTPDAKIRKLSLESHLTSRWIEYRKPAVLVSEPMRGMPNTEYRMKNTSQGNEWNIENQLYL